MSRLIKGVGLALTLSLSFACNPPKVAEPKKEETQKNVENTKANAQKKPKKLTALVNNELSLPAGPIARVNGVEIDKGEFLKKYKKMTRTFSSRKKAVPENLSRRYQQSILNQLIDQELLNQKIQAEKIEVTEKELEEEFVEYKKMFRTEQNFQRYLKSSNGDVNQIKANLKHNKSVTKLLEKTSELKVTDEEVAKYYKDHLNRYTVKEQIRASHILFKAPKQKKGAPVDEAKEKEILKKANEVYKLAIKPNAKFSDLAKTHSEGPTRLKGGDLNYFTRGRMDPRFEEAAFKMKVGEVSKPIRSNFGYHIIKVVHRKEGRQRTLEEVKASISKLLTNKKNRKAKAQLLKTLRSEAKIEKLLPDLQKRAKNVIRPTRKPGKLNPSITKNPIKGKTPLNVPKLRKEISQKKLKHEAKKAEPKKP